MTKNRNYCFTQNNYVNTVFVDTVECEFIAYSLEVAPSTGTPHIQGYIHWKHACSVATARRRLPGCHVEIMRGRFDQNEVYCSKSSTLIKRGNEPIHNDNNGANEISRWEQYKQLAIQGKLDEIHPKVFIQYYATLKRIRLDYRPIPQNLTDVCGIWIYGPPGSGKTRTVCEVYPDHYEKMGNKWWDDYEGEPIVFMDEFDHCHVKECAPLLKHWADYKRFRCENKGASMLARPLKFIVCSNHHLNELISTGEPLYQAISRRFRFIQKTDLSHNISSLI